MMVYFLPLLMILSSQVLKAHTEQEFHVRPADRQDCHGKQPCHSLQTYLEDVELYFHSSTVFHFLKGTHMVNWSKSTSVTVSNVSDFVMKGPPSESGSSLVAVLCNWNLEFCFTNVNKLTISNIEFIQCGFKTNQSSCPLIMKGLFFNAYSVDPHLTVPAAIKLADCHTVSLNNVSIRSSYKYGMIGVNVLGLFVISGSVFTNNSWGQAHKQFVGHPWPTDSYIPWKSSGGNTLLLYDNTVTHNDDWHGLKVNNSVFSYGTNYQYCTGPVMHQGCGGAGLGVFIKPTSLGPLPKLHFVVEDSIFHDNIAQYGAHVLVIHDYDGYKQNLNVYIRNCTFRNGKALESGGGIRIYNGDAGAIRDYIEIRNSKFFNNSAPYGGGIDLLYYIAPTKRKLFRSCIVVTDCFFYYNQAKKGAGMHVDLELSPTNSASCVHVLELSQTVMSNNTATIMGGGVSLILPSEIANGGLLSTPSVLEESEKKSRIIISTNTFQANNAASGSAISLQACTVHHDLTNPWPCGWVCTKGFQFLFLAQNTTFTNNSGPSLYLEYIGYAKLVGLQFVSNTGGGVLGNQSDIYMDGDTLFAENTATVGGAIRLTCDPLLGEVSRLNLFSGSRITIVHNSAKFGGGISANMQCKNDHWCFFQLPSLRNLNSSNTTDFSRVIMRNNSALVAGDSLYGGPISDCYILTKPDSVLPPLLAGIEIFKAVFDLNGEPYISRVASFPYRICICEGSSPEEYCKSRISVDAFRGAEFHISAIVSGQTRGAYAASVRATSTNSARLGPLQSVQQLVRSCGDLTYSLRTSASYAQLHLTVESIDRQRDSPTTISVTLLSCPFGFQEEGDPPSCGCMTQLSAVSGVTCDINTQRIYRPGDVWIGNYSKGLAVHRNCPFNYCKDSNNITLDNQNEQCAHNRSGVLCGMCTHGLSLALGSSKCLPCSSLYLILVIPLGLAGVILLLCLLKCNLTVSVGSVNGLIFYANIIQANKTTFFHVGTTNLFTQALSVFISWVNLDLGIETCFYRGMDAYAKTWLQFVFPVYVWVVILVLVYSSRYSITVSRFAGSNAVPVLATLFLLSYSKLLRTVITAITPISITDKHGTTSLLWHVDGNVSYLTWPHATLFTIALAALFLYIIPLTLFVLLSPKLQAWSNWRLFTWVNKVGPLLDAYQGPYKLKYRYWTGVMLVVRLIMFVVFAANALGDPKVNLLSVSLILVLLLAAMWNIGIPYKKYPVHVLETFYLLNLALFTIITLYLKGTQSSQEAQEYVSCIMVGTALLVFLIIVSWHFTAYVNTFRHLKDLPALFKQKGHDPPTEVALQPPQVRQKPTVSVIELNVLRESLLTQ